MRAKHTPLVQIFFFHKFFFSRFGGGLLRFEIFRGLKFGRDGARVAIAGGVTTLAFSVAGIPTRAFGRERQLFIRHGAARQES